jgi:hypothetical protein
LENLLLNLLNLLHLLQVLDYLILQQKLHHLHHHLLQVQKLVLNNFLLNFLVVDLLAEYFLFLPLHLKLSIRSSSTSS